jgi:hypothetical protein
VSSSAILSHRPPLEHEGVIRQEGIEVGTRAAFPGDLASGAVLGLGLPVVLQPKDEAHVVGLARPEASATRIGEVGEQAVPRQASSIGS